MALVRIPTEKRSIAEPAEIAKYLATMGIDYERWEAGEPVAQSAPTEEILAAYAPQIERLKAQGGYVTADVIDVNSQTPGLDAMLARFNTEHWHDEDEMRYIVEGRGVFHIIRSKGRWSRSRSKRAISFACRAAPCTGSTFAPNAAFARFVCSRIRPAGRRTTPQSGLDATSIRSASAPHTFARFLR